LGIDKIKKDILDNTKNQTKSGLLEAEKEKKAMFDSAHTSVERIKEKLEKEAEFVIEQYRIASIAEVTSSIKKQKLTIEREVISAVFQSAEDKLSKLGSKAREKHLLKLLKGEKEFNTVYCAKKDIPLIKKYKPESMDMLGGVVLENTEGNVRVDLSYESLLTLVKQERLADITKILFS